MFNVNKRVSFAVVIALLLGWGGMSIMIFQSSEYLLIAEAHDGTQISLPRGIKFTFQIDKKIYRGGEPVLLSLRNDSRKPITLATDAGGCGLGWWILQRQGAEETDWRIVSRSKEGCTRTTTGLEAFPQGTLKTDEWNGLIQTAAIGEVFLPAETGTYRMAVPYQVGEAEEKLWATADLIVTPSFTIQ